MAKIRSKKTHLIIAALVLVFLPPFAKYQELRYKNRKLEEKIEAVRKENKRLEEEKHRLETDIGYIEKRAREKIGVVRKGEIVLKEPSSRK
ncbi:MAG: septum formation initiator family protein [Candidatus Omnitrophota bacterium]|nr:septum formation initiator family protein [Candidatus Omnitrophota bacterium]